MYVELGPYLLGSQPTVNVHVADSRALHSIPSMCCPFGRDVVNVITGVYLKPIKRVYTFIYQGDV